MWTPKVDVHLGVITRDGGGGEVRKAIKIILHPKLNFHYDLALIKLVSPLSFFFSLWEQTLIIIFLLKHTTHDNLLNFLSFCALRSLVIT